MVPRSNGIILFVTSLVLTCVYADVVVRISNDTKTEVVFSDMMAAFGPSISDKGVTGYVYNVVPSNACEPVAPPPEYNSSLSNVNWIALIQRDNCTFVEKVRNVQQWSRAAIVYNHKFDDKIETMHGDGRDILIPSVFMGYSDGKALSEDYCFDCKALEKQRGKYTVTIDNREPYYNPYILWPFAVVVGTCFFLIIIFMLVKWCRDLRKKRRSRLSTKHLKKIPTKKFKKGDEYDVCAICLDDYEEGDKLRLLPCSHVYHTKCIDPWLTKNKRCCPICKRKVIPGPDPDDSDSSDEETDTPSENTPLLGGSRPGGSSNRRSTFDNSGLPNPSAQTTVKHVNEEDTSSTDSDLSDSEIGAVGGVRHLNLGQENPLLSLNKSPVEEFKPSNESEAQNRLANNSIEEQAVVETSGRVYSDDGQPVGVDNQAYVVEGEESEDSEDEAGYHGDDVMFINDGRKEDKKNNGVV